MKLLIATPSPFARKVRVALLERHIPCEVVIDNPWLPKAQAAVHNPLGKIPILLLDNGDRIFDSKVIFEYLETLPQEPHLIPVSPSQRVAHKQVEALADGICDAVVLSVLETVRPPQQRSQDWLTRQRRKIELGVDECEQRLGEANWFVGDEFGLADVSVGCMLGYLDLRAPDYDWRINHARLREFLQRVSARASFQATIPSAQTLPTVR